MKIIKLSILVIALGVFTQTNAQDNAKKEKRQKKQFSKIDGDSNGSVSKEEIVAFYEGKKNKKGDPFDGAKIFKNKDVNKDGKLTFVEFIAPPKKWKKKKNN